MSFRIGSHKFGKWWHPLHLGWLLLTRKLWRCPCGCGGFYKYGEYPKGAA